jgi:hypothetical protein
VISAYFPDDAECTQASFPATRKPVSSKWATGVQRGQLILHRTGTGHEPYMITVSGT